MLCKRNQKQSKLKRVKSFIFFTIFGPLILLLNSFYDTYYFNFQLYMKPRKLLRRSELTQRFQLSKENLQHFMSITEENTQEKNKSVTKAEDTVRLIRETMEIPQTINSILFQRGQDYKEALKILDQFNNFKQLVFSTSIKIGTEFYTFHNLVKTIFEEIELDDLLPKVSGGKLKRSIFILRTIDNSYARINIRQAALCFVPVENWK